MGARGFTWKGPNLLIDLIWFWFELVTELTLCVSNQKTENVVINTVINIKNNEKHFSFNIFIIILLIIASNDLILFTIYLIRNKQEIQSKMVNILCTGVKNDLFYIQNC